MKKFKIIIPRNPLDIIKETQEERKERVRNDLNKSNIYKNKKKYDRVKSKRELKKIRGQNND